MPKHMSGVKTVATGPVAPATFFQETLTAIFKCIVCVGGSYGDGGALGKVQAYIGLDRGAISTNIACPSVSVGLRLQQPREAER